MFKRQLRKFARWILNDKCEEACRDYSVGNSNNNIGNSHNAMNFAVYSASGGKVIQFSHYDETRDRVNSTLYIIADGEDLGEQLALIIVKESLMR